jgi:hypothetical protein
MRPKYEVGEVVILASKMRPELAGDYVVESRTFYSEILDVATGEVLPDGGYLYLLEGIEDQAVDGWLESSLRKKHTPGEMTFDNLMASLSSPKLITHQT